MKFSFRAAPAFSLMLAFLLGSLGLSAQTHLIISQLYGGGGNSGSVYSNDFVELYNPTASPVNLSGYSLQYAASTGTFSASNNLALQGTVAGGRYFLIKLAPGSTTPAPLPTPDFDATTPTGQNVLNLSGTGGKIALVNSTTTLSAGCPTAAAYVDFVGWGTTANCSYNDSTGANKAPATTNATGLSLNSTNAWTGVNSADYTAGTPNPRNSSYGGTPAGALTIASASATPATVTAGNSTVLSVTVAPGTSTTNIAVKADLSQFSGSATQALTLSSTNTYTYSFAVPGSTAGGSYTIPVQVTSSDPTVIGSIALSVTVPLSTTAISTIQANRSTYVGTTIQTTGIITVVTSPGFYMQTISSTPGSTGDEGLYVYRGSSTVAGIAVGNSITVSGTLTLYPAAATTHTPSLELTSPSVTVISTGNTLPTPIQLSASSLSATGGIYQLRPYEGMLVKFPSLTAITPTDGTLVESTETATSTGQFFVTATGVARPFREPGMDFRDFPTTTCPTLTNCTATATSAGVARPANLVLYDDNPERLIVESSLGGGTALDVSTGAVITNATGVVDFTYSTDVPYGDPARLVLLASSGYSSYTPGITVQPLALPGSGEVTIAAFNIERFFNPSASDNKYFNAGTGNVGGSSAVNVTQDAYNRRLKKVSVAIRNVLNAPDVLSIEEVENVSVLNDIGAQIDADATAAGQTPPHYAAYGTDSVTTYTDDVGGISIGFLVKPATVNVVSFEQMGARSTFQASTGTQTLNDRPSDVLHVGFKRPNGAADYPMTLISNHLRSLNGIGTSADTRLKKELQAEMLATLIQGYQTNGEHVLAMGDINAFEFSDGYTDTVGTITGRVADPTTVVQAGRAIVNPVATDLATLLPAAQRQSYVEFGNAQILDHIIATADIASTTRLAYAHLNSDFPAVLLNDATSPSRTSDHDAAVAYVPLPTPSYTGTLTGLASFPDQAVGTTSSPSQVYTVTNTGTGTITITGITATGDFAQSNNCQATLAISTTCSINVTFTPTATGARTGTLAVTSNATGITPRTLTGNGLPIMSAITFAVADRTFGSAPFTVAATSGSAGAFTYSVISGPATISGNTVTLAGAGTVTLQVAQAAGGNYAAATQRVSFNVAKALPVVTFARPAAIPYGTALGSAQLNATATVAGTFVYTPAAGTVLSGGTQTLSVQFTPTDTSNYATPAAAATTIVVNPATTATTVTSSANPSASGSPVTFTAAVASSGPTPTGTVVFAEGSTVLATVALSGGQATYTTSALSVASHTITASFQANANGLASTGSVTQVVNSAPFFLTSGGTGTLALTVTRGSTVTTQLTISPFSGFTGTVTLSCTNLPASVTCYFFTPTLTFAAGGAAQTSALRIDTGTLTSSLRSDTTSAYGPRLAFVFWMPGMLLAGLAARSRRLHGGSRLLLVAFLLLGAAGLGALTGCGNSNSSGNTAAAGTSTINVVATSSAGTQTLPITLTVQ